MPDGTPPQVDDEELVLRMMDEDETALADLLSVYGGKILGFLIQTYGSALDRSECELVLHYAAYNVWRFADRFDPSRCSLRGWFIRVAQNAAISFIRQEKKHMGKELEYVDGYDPMDECSSDDPPADEKDRWEVTQLRDIIENELSPSERLITESDLAAGGEADSDWLAEKLGSSKNSVYAMRSKARAKIRKSMMNRQAKHERGDK